MFLAAATATIFFQINTVLGTSDGEDSSQAHQLMTSDSDSMSMQHQRLLGMGNSISLSGNVNSGNSSGLTMQNIRLSKKRLDDKKTCRWVLDNGTLCGKTFSKFDSLRRHVQELHKGIRPYVCGLCEKSYGRRDYLDRHLKTHTEGGSGGDSLIGMGDHSVSVSVCGEDEDVDHVQDDESSASFNEVVTVITDE